MSISDPKLLVQPSPLLKQGLTTPRAMLDVWLALTPVTLFGVWQFGFSALLVILTTIGGAVITEWWFTAPEQRRLAMSDSSGALTGLLLALTLPPGLPLWMAFIGGMVSTGIGKVVWGGLGLNLFNPALVGRAFLLATFPIAMTTWHESTGSFWGLYSSTLAPPLMQAQVTDALSAATPLGMMKFEHLPTDLLQLLMGTTGGALGETSGLLLLLGGLFLLIRGAINWRIPLAIFVSALLFSAILNGVDPVRFPTPLFTLLSGGMLLGALFMATDPVTSPLTPKGVVIFGAGIGLLVVLIRVFGGFPEGMMYAILLMNAATPLIDRVTQPRIFGRSGSKG